MIVVDDKARETPLNAGGETSIRKCKSQPISMALWSEHICNTQSFPYFLAYDSIWLQATVLQKT
jgi:hypothetical protein